MRYTVVLEATHEPDQPGWYYAHIPALDLTTHGQGVEGALSAARELVEGWLEELQAKGEPLPEEGQGFVSQIEVGNDALHGG